MHQTPILIPSVLTLSAAAIMALGLAACDRRDDTLGDVVPPADTATAPTPPPAGTDAIPSTSARGMLTVVDAGTDTGDREIDVPGAYVADAGGNALYMMEGGDDANRCTDVCLEAWPPLLVGDIQPSAGTGLQAGMVGSIQRADGAVQVTYNGHPLYRYAADTGAGRTSGHDIEDQWGEWYLVTPQGEPMEHAEEDADT